jgi:hypothetical protein
MTMMVCHRWMMANWTTMIPTQSYGWVDHQVMDVGRNAAAYSSQWRELDTKQHQASSINGVSERYCVSSTHRCS